MIGIVAALSVLCIGDSQTEAYLNMDTYCTQSAHDTVNIGIAGTTAGSWRQEIVDYDSLIDGSVVTVMLGANDTY